MTTLNKKAQLTFNIGYWIPRILFLVVAFLAVFFLVRKFQLDLVDVSDLEADLMKYRLIYSRNSISYTDEITGRVYPGIITLDDFEQARIDRSMSFGNYSRMMAMKLELLSLDGSPIKTTFYQKDWYLRTKPLVGLKGPGGAKEHIYFFPVLIKDGEEKENAVLKISIVTPNS